MKKLTILYDSSCGFCSEAKRWMLNEPSYLQLEFIPASSETALQRFPSIARTGRPEELIVISDEGGVYREEYAFILCLYALENYREWSFRLATSGMLPLARQAFRFLSRQRSKVSRALRMKSEAELVRLFSRQPAPPYSCEVRKSTTSTTQCPFCKDELAGREIVHCAACGSAHHRECWIANGYNCSVFGCQPQLRKERIVNG